MDKLVQPVSRLRTEENLMELWRYLLFHTNDDLPKKPLAKDWPIALVLMISIAFLISLVCLVRW